MRKLSLAKSQSFLPICLSLLINALVIAIDFLFGTIRFGTNDDRDISNLLANVSGHYDGCYISFMNIFFTKLMSFVYLCLGHTTNWYVLISIILSFFALTCLCVVIIKRNRSLFMGTAIAVTLVMWSSYSHYIEFQFTHNSVIYTLTGILLYTDLVKNKWQKYSWLQYAVGVLYCHLFVFDYRF